MREPEPSFESILLARFGALVSLEEGERAFFARIAGRGRDSHSAGTVIWSEANPIRPPSIIVSGWACVCRESASGARQIIEILLPGDVIGFGIQQRPVPAVIVSALTPLTTVSVPELAAVWKDRHLTPRMAARLEVMLAEQHVLLVNHVIRLGRCSAYGRMANLLAELHWRLARCGLASDADFPMPLIQEQIADTLGLSVVHVNRTLQQLRREGRFLQEKKRVRLLDLKAVYAAGEFTPPSSGRP